MFNIERRELVTGELFSVTTPAFSSSVALFFFLFSFLFFFSFVVLFLIASSVLSSIRLTRAAGFRTGSSLMAVAVASVIEVVFFLEIMASVRRTASSWLSLKVYFLRRVNETSKMYGKVASAAFFLKFSAVEIVPSDKLSSCMYVIRFSRGLMRFLVKASSFVWRYSNISERAFLK